jgi:hypothetical protein
MDDSHAARSEALNRIHHACIAKEIRSMIKPADNPAEIDLTPEYWFAREFRITEDGGIEEHMIESRRTDFNPSGYIFLDTGDLDALLSSKEAAGGEEDGEALPTKTWLPDEVEKVRNELNDAQLRKLQEDGITKFAEQLQNRMREAAKANPRIKPVTARRIENCLRELKLWPLG